MGYEARAARAALTIFAIAGALAPMPASAGTDILVRQRAPFEACVAVQDKMMRHLGVEPASLAVEMDTGAVLMRKYSSGDAALVLVCNRVTDVLEVRREAPDIAEASDPAQ